MSKLEEWPWDFHMSDLILLLEEGIINADTKLLASFDGEIIMIDVTRKTLSARQLQILHDHNWVEDTENGLFFHYAV